MLTSEPHVAYPAENPTPQENKRDDTVRLWLSQQQWFAILQNTERKSREAESAPEDDQRRSPRVPAPKDMQCMIRLGENAQHTGTYIANLRDISTTGLGFCSAQPFAPKSRCTVALQDAKGHGLVCAASVVWCKAIDEQLNDVGIHFDQPIDAIWFAGDPLDRIPI